MMSKHTRDSKARAKGTPLSVARQNLNFTRPGVRFVEVSNPSKVWTISTIEHRPEGTLVHTISPDGAPQPFALIVLQVRRNVGEIDYLTDDGQLASEAFVRTLIQTSQLTETQSRTLEVHLALCDVVEQLLLVAAKAGVSLSIWGACRICVQRVSASGGLLNFLGGEDGYSDLMLAASEIPSPYWLSKLYDKYLALDISSLVPYLEREQVIPSHSAFANPRMSMICLDVIEDAKRARRRGTNEYRQLRRILDAINEQVLDEKRLRDLDFVLAEEAHLRGSRTDRQKLCVYWDSKRELCIALGVGGDTFFRPCRIRSEYEELTSRLLRPPNNSGPDHPYMANKPYYREADLSEIAKMLSFEPAAYIAALNQLQQERQPLSVLHKHSFYRRIASLAPRERGELRMTPRQLDEVFGLRLGRDHAGRIDDVWAADFGRSKIIVLDDDQLYPIGRLVECLISDVKAECRLGAALELGGEGFPVLARALRMALYSAQAKDKLRMELGLEHSLLEGHKPGELLHDLGPALLSTHVGKAMMALGIISRATPKRSPKHKSEIEQAMREVALSVADLPGATSWHAQMLKKYDYNPLQDVLVRLCDLKRLFYRTIFDEQNHKTRKSLMGLSAHQVYAAGRAALESEYDDPPPDPLLDVFLSEYYPDQRLTPSGLVLDGLTYQFGEDTDEYRYLVGRKDLLVTRDPWRLEKAYIVNIRRLSWIALDLHPHFLQAVQGLNIWQWRKIEDAHRRLVAERMQQGDPQSMLVRRQHQRDARDGWPKADDIRDVINDDAASLYTPVPQHQSEIHGPIDTSITNDPEEQLQTSLSNNGSLDNNTPAEDGSAAITLYNLGRYAKPQQTTGTHEINTKHVSEKDES